MHTPECIPGMIGEGGAVQGGIATQLSRPGMGGVGGQAQGGVADQAGGYIDQADGGQAQGGEAWQAPSNWCVGMDGEVEGGSAEQHGGAHQIDPGVMGQGGTAYQYGFRPVLATGGQRQGGGAVQGGGILPTLPSGQRQGGQALQYGWTWPAGAGGQRQGGAVYQYGAAPWIGAGGQRQGGAAAQYPGGGVHVSGGQSQGGSAVQASGAVQVAGGGQAQGGTVYQSGGHSQSAAGGETEGGAAVQSSGALLTAAGGQAQGGSATQAGANPVTIPSGRLTLQSGDPCDNTDRGPLATIYYTPYCGNTVELWNGSAWQLVTFAELSISVAAVTANKGYDVFGYLSSGALTLELLAWSSANARATAVTLQDGRYCKSGDKTRLLLGSCFVDAANKTYDSAAKRYVWNCYNRRPRRLYADDNGSHSYTTASWREWGGSTTARAYFFAGLPEDVVAGRVSAQTDVSVSGPSGRISIALATLLGGIYGGEPSEWVSDQPATSLVAALPGHWYPTDGLSYVLPIERGTSNVTQQWATVEGTFWG